MPYGIVHLAAVPVRAEPSDRSEMTSQLLFGDLIEQLETKDKWTHVRACYDGYEGWINPRQAFALEIGEYEQHRSESRFALSDAVAVAESNGWVQLLPMGASLPFLQSGGGSTQFRLAGRVFTLHGNAADTARARITEELIQATAMKLLHAPYMWGGKTALGIDCSGFTQVVFKVLGIPLKRDAYQQAEQGRAVNMLEQAQCGDAAFFHNEAGRIVHVGILLDNKTIVHASGQVRIDRIDHQGIFNVERKAYTHQLKFIKRLV
ncbi:MAG TPA: C40 family peptidase [Chitinophagales bacterium]|nr:C40 family peptidase [Chitinophagales bacterium]